MLNTIVIDDHQAIRSSLIKLLAHIPEVTVLAECNGVKEGLNAIDNLKPDLLFLDIEMNDGTGFDLLSQLPDRNIKVIFVTSHEAYAIKAFRFSAIDYLLKPVDFDDLSRAVKKANSLALPETRIETLLQNKSKLERIILSDQQSTYLIKLSDIVRCQSDVNYTKFYLVDQREIIISKPLKTYDEMFKGCGFFRSHQSHLINLRYFDYLDKKEGGVICMKQGDLIPISSRKREDLKSALELFANNHP